MAGLSDAADPADGDAAGAPPAFPMARGCPLAPPAPYADMRGRPTRVVLPTGKQAWVVTANDQVRQVLADRTVSADPRRPGFPALVPGEQELATRTRPFIRTDPPEHTRLRRMVLGHLSAHRVRELRPAVQRIVDDRLDELIAHGPPADLVTQYAHAVSVTVMCALVGVRRGDRWFGRVSGALGVTVGGAESTAAGAAGGLDGLFAVLDALLDERERDPGADLLSRSAIEHLSSGAHSRAEIVSTVAITMIAGRETTTHQIALSALALMTDPQLRARVDADHRVWPRLVEELLRVASVGDSIGLRVLTEDLTVGDVVLPAGDGIIPLLAGADHDPAVYADPGRVELDGPGRPHLAFGWGVHQCVGHNLARLELQTALACLFDRLPDLELAVPADQVRYRQFGISFGPETLPVRW